MSASRTAELREQALAYQKRGWAVLPVERGTKRPACNWLEYQKSAPSADQIRSWFTPGSNYGGIAVVLGPVSGGIAVRDFDIGSAYDNWADANPEYACMLPTVKTARGAHVYFRPPADLGLAGIKPLADGEIRYSGGIVLLPPSRHPSGVAYEWIVPLGPLDAVPEIDPAEIGLCAAEAAPPARFLGGGDVPLPPIALAQVVAEGQRNHVLFAIACSLRDKGMDEPEMMALLEAANARRCNPPLPADELTQICRSAGKYTPKHAVAAPAGASDPAESGPEAEHLTELGNAKRFVARYGKDVHYVPNWRQWIIWDGTRWKPDHTGEVTNMMKSIVGEIYDSASPAAAANLGSKERAAVCKWAIASESDRHIRASLSLASSEEDIPVMAETLDANPRLLNVLNGTLELPAAPGEIAVLREWRKADMITKICQARYNHEANYSLLTNFLNQTFQNDPDLINFAARAIGYACTGLIRENCLFIFYGTGRNGKTTLKEVVARILGDYAARTPVETLVGKDNNQGESASPNLASLKGTRMVIAAEPEAGRRLRESQVKLLTGGDTITARQLYQPPITFSPTFKIFLIANHKPRISGTDKAIWDRIHLIPFKNYIPPEQRQLDLQDQLLANPDGILNWMIEGCMMWSQFGLGSCPAVTSETKSYQQDMDLVRQFLDERCTIENTNSPSAHCNSTDLYRTLQTWLQDNGEYKMTHTALTLRLKEMGFSTSHTERGAQWNGISIIPTLVENTNQDYS